MGHILRQFSHSMIPGAMSLCFLLHDVRRHASSNFHDSDAEFIRLDETGPPWASLYIIFRDICVYWTSYTRAYRVFF
ncbi:hypothetical protein OIDMADRAFT_17040 [Oidiodendron maius Zn]|uniref:Uncharacterized protein n=1 Tax=Oidiodendron maius (strain Zn) TaxID=913774 RepID=A0A0C3D3M4_OIDMZ|nr:hypothetical protein OIDMADRAFT_17040 [Oidiodendron maius Zn]